MKNSVYTSKDESKFKKKNVSFVFKFLHDLNDLRIFKSIYSYRSLDSVSCVNLDKDI